MSVKFLFWCHLTACASDGFPDRERRLLGVGSRRNQFPRASRPRGGGGAESAEDGQPDLRHPTGNDAGSRGGGETQTNKQKTVF